MYIDNARKPKGFLGRIMLTRMNHGSHAKLSEWAFSLIETGRTALDMGCGGGANVARLTKRCDRVCGIDYSQVSVRKSIRRNRKAVKEGRCSIVAGDVTAMPFGDGEFDTVTAFETVYFWKPIDKAFAEAFRVIKAGGTFAVINDSDGEGEPSPHAERLDMTVYTAERLSEMMSAAGFVDTKIYRNAKRIVVTGIKPGARV